MRFVAGQGAVAEFLLAGSCSGAVAGHDGAAEHHREEGAGRQAAASYSNVSARALCLRALCGIEPWQS